MLDTDKRNTKMVKIKGKKYIKNLDTGKLYGMPRYIVTRAIERNLLKKKWKEHNKGVNKKYRTSFSSYWQAYKNNKDKEV